MHRWYKFVDFLEKKILFRLVDLNFYILGLFISMNQIVSQTRDTFIDTIYHFFLYVLYAVLFQGFSDLIFGKTLVSGEAIVFGGLIFYIAYGLGASRYKAKMKEDLEMERWKAEK